MFAAATQLYRSLVCRVGGLASADDGPLLGNGCMVSAHHAVTARHVWSNVRDQFHGPSIIKWDGIFRCKVIFESVEADVLLLEVVGRIATASIAAPPAAYPAVSSQWPQLGQSVGILTRMQLPHPTGNMDYVVFSEAFISINMKNTPTDPNFFSLSGGIFQRGSSGGPVYGTDGSLIGVIVQSNQFVADLYHPIPALMNLPLISPLLPFRDLVAGLQHGSVSG